MTTEVHGIVIRAANDYFHGQLFSLSVDYFLNQKIVKNTHDKFPEANVMSSNTNRLSRSQKYLTYSDLKKKTRKKTNHHVTLAGTKHFCLITDIDNQSLIKIVGNSFVQINYLIFWGLVATVLADR